MRRDKIKEALHEYRCQYTVDEEGNGIPLLDVLSPAKTVEEGAMEIDHLADFIMSKIEIIKDEHRDIKCMVCGMKDKELLHARIEDETVYRCLGCGELKNGIAVRMGYGWVCCEACSDEYDRKIRLREERIRNKERKFYHEAGFTWEEIEKKIRNIRFL